MNVPYERRRFFCEWCRCLHCVTEMSALSAAFRDLKHLFSSLPKPYWKRNSESRYLNQLSESQSECWSSWNAHISSSVIFRPPFRVSPLERRTHTHWGSTKRNSYLSKNIVQAKFSNKSSIFSVVITIHVYFYKKTRFLLHVWVIYYVFSSIGRLRWTVQITFVIGLGALICISYCTLYRKLFVF